MSLIDKITKAFKLDNDDYDEFDDYDEYDDGDDGYESPKPSKFRKIVNEEPEEDVVESKPAPRVKSNVLSYSAKKKSDGKASVCVFKPTDFEEGKEIVDTLLAKNIVMLNLEGMDFEMAQRIVDFACGACYAMDGTLRKITNYIFVIAPHNVDVAGDFPDFLGDSGIKLQ